MNIISRKKIRNIIMDGICPYCQLRNSEDDWDVIKWNEIIAYGRCKHCRDCFKLRRSKKNKKQNILFCEFLYDSDENWMYTFRGHFITKRTFKENQLKFAVKYSYSKFDFSEIFDLMNIY